MTGRRFPRWLYPGMHIKRWLVLLLAGIVILGLGAAIFLRDLYRGAVLFLQPGIEDFGIAAVEALACGTPVVAAARGGILDVVEDGRHGVLYPEWEGPSALAEAIDKALRIVFN